MKRGALSWAVDGGVFRPEEGRSFMEWLRDTWGVESTIRADGPGWLFGATSYSIGATMTLDVKKGQAREWQETNNLRNIKPRNRAWLAQIFKERAGQ